MDVNFSVQWFALLERNVLLLIRCDVNFMVRMVRPPSSDIEDWYTSFEIVNFGVPWFAHLLATSCLSHLLACMFSSLPLGRLRASQ